MSIQAIPPFDQARIPDVNDQATFHDDATYAFEHLSQQVIPRFNANFAWLETALVGDASTFLELMQDHSADGNLHRPKNYIINGGFDIWQRHTTQTSNGYGSDDRWMNSNVGSTKVHSREDFTIGQTDVKGHPEHFSRTVVTSVPGAGNFTAKQQRIENVVKNSDGTYTATFYGKADAPKDIAVELTQFFGTGGSPDAEILITPQIVSLTTSWQKFSLTFVVPSVTGKTLGTNNDDSLRLVFWFESGSTHSARSGGIGQQSGTFDIAKVSLNVGDTTALSDPFEDRSIGQELALCQRFYQKSHNLDVVPGQRNNNGIVYSQRHHSTSTYTPVSLKTRMRAVPSVITYSGGQHCYAGYVYAASRGTYVVPTIYRTGETAFMVGAAAPSIQNPIEFHYTVEAEL